MEFLEEIPLTPFKKKGGFIDFSLFIKGY